MKKTVIFHKETVFDMRSSCSQRARLYINATKKFFYFLIFFLSMPVHKKKKSEKLNYIAIIEAEAELSQRWLVGIYSERGQFLLLHMALNRSCALISVQCDCKIAVTDIIKCHCHWTLKPNNRPTD